ncbi:MAG TPA: hypothetical protein PKJ63_15695, partial [Cyclobacteriaceae bacterium]|nr:hypothetical protein [Cyclobacteriaceae bacterium]
MKRLIGSLAIFWFTASAFGQELVFPFQYGWNILSEGDELSFQLKARDSVPDFFRMEGIEALGIQFDTLGNFYWQPSYDLVSR